MSAVPETSRTHVIRLVARIGDQQPSIGIDEVREAVAPRVPVDDGLLLSLDSQDGSEMLYRQAAEALSTKVPGFIEHRVATSGTNHLSIFGFAPMPLLMLLGRTLGDKRPADVYERHRHSDSWRWDKKGPMLDWTTVFPARPIRGRAVALLLSVSGTIAMDGVRQALVGDFDVVELGLPLPQRVPNIVRNHAQLRGFAEQWRATLNRIKVDHEPTQVHVFPAAPLSVCIELGRRLLPKSDPDLIIYDRFGVQFRRALSLRGPEPLTMEPETRDVQQNWRESLVHLFATALEPFELCRWLDGLEDEFSNYLGPSSRLSPQELADAAQRRLERRGMIDERFFDELGKQFSHKNRRDDVEKIRASWRHRRTLSS